MQNAQPLFNNVVQDATFWDHYFLDSNAILLVGFTLLVFLILQIALTYGYVKRKSWWIIFVANLVTAAFTWVTTLYFLYPDLILGLIF